MTEGLQQQLFDLLGQDGSEGLTTSDYNRPRILVFPNAQDNDARERIHEIAIGTANKQHPEKRPAYLGVGGLHNIAHAHACNADSIILFDVNHLQLKFWRDVIEIAKECETLDAFNASLLARTETQADSFPVLFHFSDGSLHRIYMTRDDGRAKKEPLFQDADVYAYFHQRATMGNIAVIHMDLLNSESCAALKSAMDDLSLSPRIIYTSNITSFISDQPHPAILRKYGSEKNPESTLTQIRQRRLREARAFEQAILAGEHIDDLVQRKQGDFYHSERQDHTSVNAAINTLADDNTTSIMLPAYPEKSLKNTGHFKSLIITIEGKAPAPQPAPSR